jgi:hypothetical protein
MAGGVPALILATRIIKTGFFFFLLLPLSSTGLISQVLDHSQTAGLLGPKYRTTQAQKNPHTSNIHALSGIRTHDPGFQPSEDRTLLRFLGLKTG